MGFINSKEKVGTSLFLLFSLCYLNLTFEIPLNTFLGDELFTARTMPIFLSTTAIFFSLIHLFLPVREKRSDNISEAVAGFEWRLCTMLLLLMLVYGLTFQFFGFALGTFMFLLFGFSIMREKRWVLSVSVAAAIAMSMWAILTQLFDIYLDPGELFRLVVG